MKKEVDTPPELDQLFSLINPLCGHQQALLREIELRVTTWEGRGSAALRSEYQRVGDVLLRHFQDVVVSQIVIYQPLEIIRLID